MNANIELYIELLKQADIVDGEHDLEAGAVRRLGEDPEPGAAAGGRAGARQERSPRPADPRQRHADRKPYQCH